MIGYHEDEETFKSIKPHNRFRVWEGRDFWHQDRSTQIRLEPDGSVHLSTQDGHVSTLKLATIPFGVLHDFVKKLIDDHQQAQHAITKNELDEERNQHMA